MRTRRKAAVATLAAVSGCLVLATQVPMVASAAATGVKGDVSITNTETVDAKLSATGTVSSQRIYDQLIVTGDGSVDIENPVSTDGLRNLNGFGGPSVRDGKQRISTSVKGEKAYRSVADYDGDLPVDVRVEYRLDGEKVKPGDVVGKDGTLEVTYSVRNMTGEQQEVTYTDGEGKEQTRTMAVVVPLVGSMSTVLPSNFTDVQSEQANAAGDGKGGTLLSFTMTLFPPIGSDRTTFGYTAEITDGIIPEANMSVLPVNPLESPSFSGGAESYKGGADAGVDLTEGATTIDQNLLKIRDGAEELVAGILQLDDGAGQLTSGTGELTAGADRLSGGAGDLNSGAQQLNAGAGRADAGSNALLNGLRKLAAGTTRLDSGADELNGGATRLVNGVGQLDDGAQALSRGLADLVGGASAATQGANRLAAGAAELAGGAARLDAGLNDAAGKTPLLVAGIGQLSGGLDQLAGSLPQAQAGASGVAGGLGQLDVSLGQLRAGVEALKGYAPLIQDPAMRAQFEGSVDQLAGGLSQASGGITSTMIPTLQQVAGGLQAAVAGLGNAEQPQTLRSGAAQLAAGLQALDAGLEALSTGSGDLLSGTQALAGGASELGGGLGQLGKGADVARNGAGRLAGGTADLRTKSKELKSGTERLSAGAAQVDDGTKTAVGGSGQLADGIAQLLAGTGKLAAGTGELAPGAVKLAEGAGKLNEGAGKLADGLDQAAKKAPALPDGAQQLSEQGTSQLVNVGNSTAMSYGEKYALIEAGAERASQLQPYGSPEGATSRTAYKLTLSAEDGEDRANLLRAGAAAAVALLGLGGLALRRRLR